MKIVSISGWTGESISGYVDDGRSYKGFHLTLDGVSYRKPMPKRRWGLTSLELFAGVIGKFDPDAFVLEEPIEVGRLDFRALDDLLSKDGRFEKGGNERG